MKKLTAGIFTVMLGLCATSGADAAVASKGYVDSFVGEQGSITSAVTSLTQTVADNKTAAENAIAAEKSARETAVSGLDTRLTTAEGTIAQHTSDISAINAELDTMASDETVTELQAQVGTGTVDSRIETAKQAAIDAAAADATSKANKALTDAKADAEKYIDATELADSLSEQNTAIETAYKAADKAITDSIGTVPADKTVVGMIADAQTAATYDDDEVRGLISANADAIAANEAAVEANAASIATNTGAITTLNGDASTTGSVAKSIADAFTAANLDQYAKTSAMETALMSYELKSNLKALAYKDTVGTDDIDNLAVTTAKLADGAVESGKIANGAVTDDKISAVSSSKVTGLSESLAEKLTIPTAASETDGKYVLTATSANGQATYYWELIAREGE